MQSRDMSRAVLVSALVSAFVASGTIYLYPRIMDRWEFWEQSQERPARREIKSCQDDRIVRFGTTPDMLSKTTKAPVALSQHFVPIQDLSTVIEIPVEGVLDISLKLEARHMGGRYGEAIGFGSYITYQHAEALDELDQAALFEPTGWRGGTNIRDLRDHYGQINIIGAVAVKPGFYRFCVIASAHSALTRDDGIAELLIEKKTKSMNSLRLSFKPGGKLLM
jgi:hypothetical protein